jgi:hypothetical protein
MQSTDARALIMTNSISQSSGRGRCISSVTGFLAFTLVAVSGVTGAMAQGCNLSGAVGSQTDVSTTQALELIRDRRMQIAWACPAGSAPSADGTCMAVSGS